jgi:hypothetical protein
LLNNPFQLKNIFASIETSETLIGRQEDLTYHFEPASPSGTVISKSPPLIPDDPIRSSIKQVDIDK